MEQLQSVEEHGLLTNIALTPEDVRVLLRTPAVSAITPTLEAGRWDIRAGLYVGTVPLPTGRELRVLPKLPVERVLFLAAYARDQSGWTTDPASFERAPDLVTGIAVAFAVHAGRALRRGVLQGYQTREEALPGLRGRLRETEQLARHFGIPLPVEVRYDDFTRDITENQLLRTASQLLLRMKGLPVPTMHRLRHIDAVLGDVGLLPRGRPPVIPITRLNEHYRPGLEVARLVLEATSFDVGRGPTPGSAFLFSMFRVFEDFLTVALTAALERRGGKVNAQQEAFLDDGELKRIDVRPDLIWWRDGRCAAVIDAKYKRLDTTGIHHPDVYQAIAYALALDTERAHLIYAENPPEIGEHAVRGTAVQLTVSVLDLSLPPTQVLGDIERIAAQIAFTTSKRSLAS